MMNMAAAMKKKSYNQSQFKTQIKKYDGLKK